MSIWEKIINVPHGYKILKIVNNVVYFIKIEDIKKVNEKIKDLKWDF